MYALLQLRNQLVQGPRICVSGLQGRAHCGKEMGIFRIHHMVRREVERADESLFQFRQKVQRTAQKGHAASDRLAAGQAGNGLIYDGLKNRGGQIRQGGAFVDQRLNVRLGKDAAAGGNGIDLLIIGGCLVETLRVGL